MALTQEQQTQIEQQTLTSKISLNLAIKDVNVLLNLLGKYPFEEVNAIIKSIQDEGQSQVQKIIADLETKANAESSATEAAATQAAVVAAAVAEALAAQAAQVAQVVAPTLVDVTVPTEALAANDTSVPTDVVAV